MIVIIVILFVVSDVTNSSFLKVLNYLNLNLYHYADQMCIILFVYNKIFCLTCLIILILKIILVLVLKNLYIVV